MLIAHSEIQLLPCDLLSLQSINSFWVTWSLHIKRHLSEQAVVDRSHILHGNRVEITFRMLFMPTLYPDLTSTQDLSEKVPKADSFMFSITISSLEKNCKPCL